MQAHAPRRLRTTERDLDSDAAAFVLPGLAILGAGIAGGVETRRQHPVSVGETEAVVDAVVGLPSASGCALSRVLLSIEYATPNSVLIGFRQRDVPGAAGAPPRSYGEEDAVIQQVHRRLELRDCAAIGASGLPPDALTTKEFDHKTPMHDCAAIGASGLPPEAFSSLDEAAGHAALAGNRLLCLVYGPLLLFGYLTADDGAATFPAQGSEPEVRVSKPRVLLVAMPQRARQFAPLQIGPWEVFERLLHIAAGLDRCAVPL